MSNQPSGGFFGRFLRTLFLGVIAISLGSMALRLFFPDRISTGSDNQIAIVEVTGMITDSRDIVRQLKEYRRDDNIKGIILRIDSPGGSVAPSQEIYDEVLKIKDNNKKVFASLGNMAASGGYYIASPADMVVANPGTLTGSIGVIMAFSNIEELIKKIGMRPEVIKSGQFKDSGSPVRPMSKTERNFLQGVVDDVHEQFMEAVAKGRNLPKKKVIKIADGRIFTGRQALKLKLVDHLGGLEETIDLMAKTVGIKGRPVVVRETEQRGFLEFLLQSYFPHKLSQSLTQSSIPSVQYLWTTN
jgi:protease-4